jgi:hypothetical protein
MVLSSACVEPSSLLMMKWWKGQTAELMGPGMDVIAD